MDKILTNKRPVYLNLFKIKLPLMGMVSFAHRISGILLFLAIPFGVYLLHLSTVSAAGFDEVIILLDSPLVKLINTSLIWSISHHFFAGIRFLLMDVELGVEKQSAINSAKLVVLLELVATLILLYWIWL